MHLRRLTGTDTASTRTQSHLARSTLRAVATLMLACAALIGRRTTAILTNDHLQRQTHRTGRSTRRSSAAQVVILTVLALLMSETTLAYVPPAPDNLRAHVGNGRAILDWDQPAGLTSNDGHLLKYEYQQKPDNGSWGEWKYASDGQATGLVATGLANATEYSFRVRAVYLSGAGQTPGRESNIATTTPAPQFALYVSSNGFRQGGEGVTATISITDGYVLETAQTFSLEWLSTALNANYLLRSDNPTTVTLPAGRISASLVIRGKNIESPFYSNPIRSELVAKLGGTVIDKKPLTLYDQDSKPVVTLSTSTPVVNEGETISLTVTLSAKTDAQVPLFLSVPNQHLTRLTNIPIISNALPGIHGTTVPSSSEPAEPGSPPPSPSSTTRTTSPPRR